MSKETVNRLLAALGLILCISRLGAAAQAQVALVVGSVRDQHGTAVAGASVSARSAAGTQASALTDASGTFALQAEGVAAVEITCRFCRPLVVAVKAGEPVVAIVRRYDALAASAPSNADLASLPYEHVDESVGLRPFTLLAQTTHVFPGSQVSDRGLQPRNALLVDAGVPNYDVVLGLSPYDTIPASYEQSANVLSAPNAFLYGDQAGSGIVVLSPFGDTSSGTATGGSSQTARFAYASPDAQFVAGTYSNAAESRQRADAQVTLPLSTAQSVTVSAGSEQGRTYRPELGDNFTFARAALRDTQPTIDLYAAFTADRGDYAADYYGTLASIWSDVDVTAGLRTRGTTQIFGDVSTRLSTGIYDAQASGNGYFGSEMTQNRIDAGIETSGPDYHVIAGVGVFGAGYSGGAAGSSGLQYAHLATPSLTLDLFPQSNWSGQLSASSSFDLPTLWQQYGYDDDYLSLDYDRDDLYAATLSYTDSARVRASWEEAVQDVHGFDNGRITSSGLDLVWQMAPALSLRAWTMLVTDGTAASPNAPAYAAGQPNVNALWLTYDNGALRVDAIYRRDLLNNAPFYHVDGDVSGPLRGGLRWYAGVSDRLKTTSVDAGLRLFQ